MLVCAAGFLVAFAVFTVLVCTLDLQRIGPCDSEVGFAGVNGAFHRLTGVHPSLYRLTDLLGLVPIFAVLGFAALGLSQWIGRKSLRLVDRSLFVLGGFYILLLAVYVFFEAVPVNFRPVLIEGRLEASYPSSTTLLSLCVMETARRQLGARIKERAWRRLVSVAILAFTAFMVMARLASGVHWLTDIVGGALLSMGLVFLYDAVV